MTRHGADEPAPIAGGANGDGRRTLLVGRLPSLEGGTPPLSASSGLTGASQARRPVPDAPAPRRRLSAGEWTRLGLLALAVVVLGATTGFLVAGRMPQEYAARADVLYAVTREQPTGFLREDRNISTQLVVLRSRTVLGPVADQWELPVEELSAALSVAVVDESEVISVELTDTDPERAEDMLGAVLASYLELSPNDTRADVRDYLNLQLTEVVARIAAVPPGIADRQGVLAPLIDREQWLRTRLDELSLADLAGPAAEVLGQPYVGSDPVSPRPAVSTAAGAATGLLVAALVVALLARRMTRPDVERT